MTPTTTQPATPGSDGLLVRFLLLVVSVVAAAVAAFAIGTTWALIAAVGVLAALLLNLVVVLSRYLNAADDTEVDWETAVVPSKPAAGFEVRRQAPPDGTRLLVLAGEAARSFDQVPSALRALIAGADNVFSSRPDAPVAHRVAHVGRRSSTLTEAKDRLDLVLRQLHDVNIEAAGAVGDDTPATVVGDAMRRFDPDHVLIAARSRDHADWQERRLTDAIENELLVPLTAFEVAADTPVAHAGR